MAKEKIPIDDLAQFLVDHIIETLLFNEKQEILNYIYSLKTISKNSFEWFVKSYFENISITTKNFASIILYNLIFIRLLVILLVLKYASGY